MCDFCGVFIVFEVHELSVDEGVLDASMSEEMHYVEDVFGFGVFHCDLKATERVDAYPH